MTLDYITIPTAILRLKDLNIRQKVLLALVISFNEQGLKMSNKAIAELLDVWPCRVSGLLKDMESKDYIRVDNSKSRYRTIYLSKSAKVDEILLITKSISKKALLFTKSKSTFHESENINNPNIEKCAHKAQKLLDDSRAFDRFWQAYPKKQKKLDAQKAWRKLNPDPEFAERIIRDVKQRSQLFDWQKENAKYVPMPTTYLNGRRCEDELPEPKRGDPNWLPDEQETEQVLRECGILR